MEVNQEIDKTTYNFDTATLGLKKTERKRKKKKRMCGHFHRMYPLFRYFMEIFIMNPKIVGDSCFPYLIIVQKIMIFPKLLTTRQ